jgi:hypothetical protein
MLVTGSTLRLALTTAVGGNGDASVTRVEILQWVVDQDTNAFYGSAFCH